MEQKQHNHIMSLSDHLERITRGEWQPGRTMVLSVNTAGDRRISVDHEVVTHGLGPIEYHLVDRHPSDGALGCLDGHLQMIAMAKARNWPAVLLLEDDIAFDASQVTRMGQCSVAPDDWDMLYLGGHPHDGHRVPSSPGWLRIFDTLTTHAYLLRSTLYDKVLAQQWHDHAAEWSTLRADSQHTLQNPLSRQTWNPLILTGRHDHALACRVDWSKRAIDVFYGHYLQRDHPCYMLYPMVALQRSCASLIENGAPITDYNPLMQWKARYVAQGGARTPTVTLVLAFRPLDERVVNEVLVRQIAPALKVDPAAVHLQVTWIEHASATTTTVAPFQPMTVRFQDELTSYSVEWLGLYATVYQSQFGRTTHMVVSHEVARPGSRGWCIVDASEDAVDHLYLLDTPWVDSTHLRCTDAPVSFRPDAKVILQGTYLPIIDEATWATMRVDRLATLPPHLSLSLSHPMHVVHLLTELLASHAVLPRHVLPESVWSTLPTTFMQTLSWGQKTMPSAPLLLALRRRLGPSLRAPRESPLRESDSPAPSHAHLAPEPPETRADPSAASTP